MGDERIYELPRDVIPARRPEVVAPPKPPPPLTKEEADRVRENIALIKKHMPEMVPVIRLFHAAGLMRGWRDVISVEVLPTNNEADK